MIRNLIRIAVLAASGREPFLRREIRSARAKRIPLARIQESILQTYLFAGFPRAINGFWVLEEEWGKVTRPPVEGFRSDWKKRGERLCRKIYGKDYEPLMRKMKRFHPDLADWILREGYGKVLSRKFLTAKQRELIVIGMLTAGAIWRQLPSHIKGARNVGASAAEIRAAFAALKGICPKGRIERGRKMAKEARGLR